MWLFNGSVFGLLFYSSPLLTNISTPFPDFNNNITTVDSRDRNGRRREDNDNVTMIGGVCFLFFSIYITYDYLQLCVWQWQRQHSLPPPPPPSLPWASVSMGWDDEQQGRGVQTTADVVWAPGMFLLKPSLHLTNHFLKNCLRYHTHNDDAQQTHSYEGELEGDTTRPRWVPMALI